jgi:outer membrane protein W
MRGAKVWFILPLVLTTFSDAAKSQEVTLKGRSALELNIGLWGSATAATTVTTGGVTSEAKTSGLGGNLLYSYWMREYLSLTFSAGFLAGEASSSAGVTGVDQHASAVIPILIGARFYVPEPDPGEKIRPYLAAAAGSFVASEAANTGLAQEAHTEAAFGGRAGIGVEFLVGRHFKFGAGVGYNLMTDFENPVGGRKNYNGGEFTLGAGYIF